MSGRTIGNPPDRDPVRPTDTPSGAVPATRELTPESVAFLLDHRQYHCSMASLTIREWLEKIEERAALAATEGPTEPATSLYRGTPTPTSVATEARPETDLDAFTAKNARAMRDRLDHGARKFGALSWREQPYLDPDNRYRLHVAVDHLEAALRQYRLGSIGEDELRKRAADVANQAFMLADPLRRDERP